MLYTAPLGDVQVPCTRDVRIVELMMRSEIPSGMCVKLRTVAASNNRDHASQSLLLLLARSTHTYFCSSCTSRSWWITQSTQYHQRGCNTIRSYPAFEKWYPYPIRILFWLNSYYPYPKTIRSVLWCTKYIFVLCLFCLVRQNNCWSFFAFSWTWLVEVVTWQVWNAYLA